MMVSFVLFFLPRGVLDEILNLIESVSEGFPSYFCRYPDTEQLLKPVKLEDRMLITFEVISNTEMSSNFLNILYIHYDLDYDAGKGDTIRATTLGKNDSTGVTALKNPIRFKVGADEGRTISALILWTLCAIYIKKITVIKLLDYLTVLSCVYIDGLNGQSNQYKYI